MLSLLAWISCALLLVWLYRRRHQRGNAIWWNRVFFACAAAAVAIISSPAPGELRKSIALLLMPCGLLWLGLTAVTLFAWLRHRRLALACGALWLALTVLGNAPLSTWMMRGWVAPYADIDPRQGETLDAIWILGGGAQHDPVRGAIGGQAADRLLMAARCYRHGRSPLLVCSGRAFGVADQDPTVPGLLLLEDLGVPNQALLNIRAPSITSEEIRALATVQAEYGWQRVGVLSSAWHLPRAERLCRRNGIEAEFLPAGPLRTQHAHHPWWIIPSAGALDRMQVLCWEWLGILAGQ